MILVNCSQSHTDNSCMDNFNNFILKKIDYFILFLQFSPISIFYYLLQILTKLYIWLAINGSYQQLKKFYNWVLFHTFLCNKMKNSLYKKYLQLKETQINIYIFRIFRSKLHTFETWKLVKF